MGQENVCAIWKNKPILAVPEAMPENQQHDMQLMKKRK